MHRELRDILTSERYWISVGVILLCFFSFSVPLWLGSADWGTEYRPSALELAIEPIIFGGVIFLLPFCAAAAFSVTQVDDLQTGMFYSKLLRSSILRYEIHQITFSALAGALALGTVYAIHAIFWNVVALPYDPQQYPYHELPFQPGTFYAAWHTLFYALPIYLYMTISIGFFGAAWAIAALAVSVWIPDKLLTITIPACLYTLWSGGLFYYLFGWSLPHPADLFFDDISTTLLLQSLLSYGILLIISVILYRLGLQRRIQNEK